MRDKIIEILENNSEKVYWIGTNEESIRAEDNERMIDDFDINKIADEIEKLYEPQMTQKMNDADIKKWMEVTG